MKPTRSILAAMLACVLLLAGCCGQPSYAMYCCLPVDGSTGTASESTVTTVSADDDGNIVIEIENASDTETNVDLVADSEDASESETAEPETEITESETEASEDTYETVYAMANVNVRTGPSTDYSIVATLSKNESVTRISIGEDGWDQVLYDGEIRYVSTKYLSTEEAVSWKMIEDGQFPMVYSDDTATITVTKEWYENAWCYIAHLEFTDYSRFGTACANGSYGGGYETTSSAASRLGAILCVNGDYSAPSLNYCVARSGVVCNGGSRSLYVPGVYSSHTGLFQSAWETGGTAGIAGVTLQTLVSNGTVTDTFCFGPPILVNGVVSSSTDTGRAQRTFMGTNGEAGDLWIVVSDGRYNDGESAGLTYKQCSALLASKGCTFGIPLDGGGSSTMVFQGTVLNAAADNERAVVDFLYFK